MGNASNPNTETDRQPAGVGVSTRGRPVPEWIEALVAELRKSGLSFAQIADRLTQDGVPTAHGGLWRSSTVHQIAERRGIVDGATLAPSSDLVAEIARLREEQTLVETAEALNKSGVPSVRGKLWNPSSVSIVQRRAQLAAAAG